MKVLKCCPDERAELSYAEIHALTIGFFRDVKKAVESGPAWEAGHLARIYANFLSVVHCIAVEALNFEVWPVRYVLIPRSSGLYLCFSPGDGLDRDEIELLARWTFTALRENQLG
jgi:hypothetical protein